ncbi:MAG TPA: HAMP domain-containing sensor histidine kinase [Candidatus Binatia bacterium]
MLPPSFVESSEERPTAQIERLTEENVRLREALARSAALMQRANRLASLGVLSAGLAHEIRNPLAAMRTFAQLLPERWQDEEFRTEFAYVAVAEVDRIESLVRELLHVMHESARDGETPMPLPAPEASATATTSLTATVESLLPLLRLQALRKGVDLVFEAGDPIRVAVEPLRLRQVAMNLVLNAIDATPDSGTVAIICGGHAQGQGRRATLCVRDSGRGIAAEDLPHIFEPFFTTRADGTGLGLAITSEIVRACGGAIRAENTPGGGATFVVELPAADVADPSAVAASLAAS